MKTKSFWLVILFLVVIQTVYSADDYKPYLHKASIPKSPKIRLFGQYATSLFPGAATYSYQIEVPKGTNNLQPSLVLSYNSQAMKQRPGIVGAGWSLSQDYIYRDVNGTLNTTADDNFILILEGNQYQLIYSLDEKWHTEVEYYFRVENISSTNSNYWLLTKLDGTQYRFGYNNDSIVLQNSSLNYPIKWNLDLVQDTHANNIYYLYLKNPNAEDIDATYLSSIKYNNDQLREIRFSYEPTQKPDSRIVFEQGNLLKESRRLNEIQIYTNNNLVRKYKINYTLLNPSLSTINLISYIGSDNVSILHNITFDYYQSEAGYTNSTLIWKAPILFSDDSHTDFGVRLADVNNDGFVDIIESKPTSKRTWLNDKTSNWTLSSSWTMPIDIVNSVNADEGVRFEDVNKDGFVDIIKSKNGARNVYLNNGTGWNLSSWSIPIDFVDSSGNDLGVQLADVNGDGFVDIVQANSGTRNVYLNTGSGWTLSSWIMPTDFLSSGDTGVRIVDINGDGLPDLIKSKDGTRNAWLNNGFGWVDYSNI